MTTLELLKQFATQVYNECFLIVTIKPKRNNRFILLYTATEDGRIAGAFEYNVEKGLEQYITKHNLQVVKKTGMIGVITDITFK